MDKNYCNITITKANLLQFLGTWCIACLDIVRSLTGCLCAVRTRFGFPENGFQSGTLNAFIEPMNLQKGTFSGFL